MTVSATAAMTSEALPARTFDSVVVQDARRLYSLAFLILRDAGEAEDAVQETQLKAWRSWESLSRTDRPAAWLTRVCVNHYISRRRHLRSRGWPPIALTERVRLVRRPSHKRGRRRRRPSVSAPLSQTASGDHAQLPARVLGRGVRRIHGVPARNRAHACRARTCRIAKGAWRWLRSIPDLTHGCGLSSITTRARPCRRV